MTEGTADPAASIAALLRDAAARADRATVRAYRDGDWEQASWPEFGAMAWAAAERAATGFSAASPVLVSVDNSIGSLAVLVGLFAAGVDCVVLEGDSPLLRDEHSVLHHIGAETVVGATDTPAPY
ncbi:MAG: hypothetical protein ACRDNF_00605, partial [Streptosporangiaceae bacterium]